MGWTQAEYDALKKAVATGASEVEFHDGRKVKFRTLKQMRSLLAEIGAELGAQARKPNRTKASFNRGW